MKKKMKMTSKSNLIDCLVSLSENLQVIYSLKQLSHLLHCKQIKNFTDIFSLSRSFWRGGNNIGSAINGNMSTMRI